MTSHLSAPAATVAPFACCATVPKPTEAEAAQVPERAARPVTRIRIRGQRPAHR
jgi:hypothetical protein